MTAPPITGNALPDIFLSYADDEQANAPWTAQVRLLVQLYWPFDNYIETFAWGLN